MTSSAATPPLPIISVSDDVADDAPGSPLINARSLVFSRGGGGGGRSAADDGDDGDLARSTAALQLAGELGGAHDDDRGHSEAMGRQRSLIAKTTERLKSFRSMRAEEQSSLHRALNTVTADLATVRGKLKEETMLRYSAEDKFRDAQMALRAVEGDLEGLKDQLELTNNRVAALTIERDQLAAALARKNTVPKSQPPPCAEQDAPVAVVLPLHAVIPWPVVSLALSWCEERCRKALIGEEGAHRMILASSQMDSPPEAPRGGPPTPQPATRRPQHHVVDISDDVHVLSMLEGARREALCRAEARTRVSVCIACENGARELRARGTASSTAGWSASPPRTPRPAGAALVTGGPLHEHPPWYPPGPPTAVFHGVRAPGGAMAGSSRSVTPSSSTSAAHSRHHRGAEMHSPPRHRGADATASSPPELALTLKNMQRLLQTIQRKYATESPSGAPHGAAPSYSADVQGGA